MIVDWETPFMDMRQQQKSIIVPKIQILHILWILMSFKETTFGALSRTIMNWTKLRGIIRDHKGCIIKSGGVYSLVEGDVCSVASWGELGFHFETILRSLTEVGWTLSLSRSERDVVVVVVLLLLLLLLKKKTPENVMVLRPQKRPSHTQRKSKLKL